MMGQKARTAYLIGDILPWKSFDKHIGHSFPTKQALNRWLRRNIKPDGVVFIWAERHTKSNPRGVGGHLMIINEREI